MSSNKNSMEIRDGLIYLVAATSFMFASLNELRDLHTYEGSPDQRWIPGRARPFIDAVPSDRDSQNELQKKLTYTLRFNDNCVKWRRFLIMSLIIVIGLFGILFQRLPYGSELIVCFLFVYAILYLSDEFYRNALDKFAYQQADQILNRMK